MNANELKSLKPKKRPYKKSCGEGLHIEVNPNGSKLWRHRFRFNGKENMLALGRYPKVSLKEARRLRDEQRDFLDEGKNPSEERRYDRFRKSGYYNFRNVTTAYLDAHAQKTKTAAEDSRARFVRHVFPYIGNKAIDEITFEDLIHVIRRIEYAGKGETARRVRNDISRVFRQAMARGMIVNDPTPVREALDGHEITPYPNPDPKKLPGILQSLDEYDGQKTTRLALRLLPMLICRPGELRTLEWSEVHEDDIRLDESRTKAKIIHIIPLSDQAKVILDELRTITGEGKYVFPSVRSPDRCMSDNTLNAALRCLGYTKDELVAHSFRKIGSSALHEMGFDTLHIEKQLGHTDKNRIRAIYNHANYLDARRKMLQAWADKLDDFKAI